MHISGRFPVVLGIISIFLWSCHSSSNQESSGGSATSSASVTVEGAFDADSAYSYVQKQVDFGPRIPNTPAHDACAEWLISKLKTLSDSVTVQKTNVATHGKSYACTNIIAHFNPAATSRVLVLAHWDTRAFADADPKTRDQHFDGADDGASGVGVLLEIARQLHQKPCTLGVDLLCTDAEDAGVEGDDDSWGLGTQYWSNHAKASGYHAMYGILLDMVGGKGARFYRESLTKQFADAQSKMVWNTANSIGYSDYFSYNNLDVGITDDHTFVNKLAGIPTLDIIALQGNGDFMPWHHTINDNMKVIDRKTLKAVGQTVVQVLYTNPSY